MRVVTELVTQNSEGTRGVTEVAGGLVGGEELDEEGAKGLVLAMFGVGGLEEEVPWVC